MIFNRPEVFPVLEGLIPSFIDCTEKDYLELTSAYTKKETVGMNHSCHRILSSASSYGFMQLDEIVREIQASLHKNDLTELDNGLSLLEKYIDYLKGEYK